MSNHTITSLCYVSVCNEKGTVRLYRIADYISGEFRPYQDTDDSAKPEQEIYYIYGKANEICGDVGSIDVYEWTEVRNESNNNKFGMATMDSRCPWVEVIVGLNKKPTQMVKK